MTITVLSMIMSLILSASVYAESSSLDSVLKNAQKSLNNGDSVSTPSQILKSSPVLVPKNSDIYVRTTVSFNQNRLFPTWEIPVNTTLMLNKGNKLCPQNNCLQEFQEATLDRQGNEDISILGVLKMEDPATSTTGLKNWKIYQIIGWAIGITKVQEDTKYNQTNYFFDGLFSIGKHQGTFESGSIVQNRWHIPRTFWETSVCW